jgi:hypothetical protein
LTVDKVSSRFGACLLTVGIAFGGNVFGAAVAAAEPNDVVWDIDAYDDCMNKGVREATQCCVDSGGVLSDEALGGRDQKCQAPPSEAQISSRTFVRTE